MRKDPPPLDGAVLAEEVPPPGDDERAAHAEQALLRLSGRVFAALYHDQDSALVAYARAELQRAGLFAPDADYEGGVAECVMQLMAVLASHRPSGGQMGVILGLVDRLGRFQPLTSSDHSQYRDVSRECDRPPGTVFQDTRDTRWVSWDGGTTWQNVEANAPTLELADPDPPEPTGPAART